MSIEKISKAQSKLIKNCKNYLYNEGKKNIDISISPLCFFTAWAETPGYFKTLNLYQNKYGFNNFFILKNLISISKNHNLKIFFNQARMPKEEINLIISYSRRNDFDKHGNFTDKFFNFNSKNKNFYWVLISLDNYVPKNIRENIAIIANKKIIFKYDLFYLFKSFINLIIKQKCNLNKISHFCWEENNYSSKISYLIKKLLKILKIKNLILNYEGVPFQNQILSDVKKLFNNDVKTFGYLHCAPWPLQLDLIYKKQPLDNLIVSGWQQKKVLKKFFGWQKKKISVIPSLRFNKSKKKEFNGYLFTPYKLDKDNDYLRRLEDYFKFNKNQNLSKILVRVHPLNQKSKKHLEFKNECNRILSRYSKKKNSKTNSKYSIFLGSATGVCIQALEEGTKIIHFPNNEVVDVFSNEFWPSLGIKKIGEKIYEYRIKQKQKTFIVINEKKKFNKYFLPLLKK